MPKRWYLCPVVGDGTAQSPYRAKASDYGVNHVAVIPSNPDGTPAFPWCVVKVARASGDFADLDGDGDLDGWPNVALDTQVRDLPATVRNRLRTALERRGIDTSDVAGSTTLRQTLRRVARLLDARFHEDLADVSD